LRTMFPASALEFEQKILKPSGQSFRARREFVERLGRDDQAGVGFLRKAGERGGVRVAGIKDRPFAFEMSERRFGRRRVRAVQQDRLAEPVMMAFSAPRNLSELRDVLERQNASG